MEIIIATTNVHKIREIKDIFKSLCRSPFDLLSLLQFPDYIPPEETGTTFKENAILKATHAAAHLNRWVIADDSGLVVLGLKGSPGVYSRQYAGPNATDGENRKKLLNEMKSFTSPNARSAFYECCLALASPEGLKKCVSGVCDGQIIHEERGRNGFGYDPLFVKHDYEKTFAEIEESTKNRISHRRKAFERLYAYLESLKQ